VCLETHETVFVDAQSTGGSIGEIEMKLVSISVQVCALCLLAIVGYVTFCITIDGVYVNQPAIYWEGSFSIPDNKIFPGDALLARIVVTKIGTVHGDAAWSLVNVDTREVITFYPRSTILGSGFHDSNVRIATIPLTATPGKYFARGIISYQVNPLKIISFQATSEEFIVEEGISR
jgi:hypothetical protein